MRRLVSVGVVVVVLAAGLVAGVPGMSGAAGVGGFSSRGIPLGGQVLFGSATTTDIALMEAAVGGKVGIRRSYYQASQVSAAVDRARADLVAGRVPWLSFKAPASWAAMATGAGDAWAQDLANRLGGLPGPVWVAVHHEPEGDGPAADWKAMQQRLSPIFRAKPNIAYTMILMGWNQFFANKADQSLDVYWPGKQYIDVLGFDPYNWYDTSNSSGAKNYTWTELREYYTKITAWLDATGNSEVKWAVAETGYTDTAAAMPQNGTAPNGKRVSALGSGADWLTRAYDDMKAMGGIALTYFNVSAATNNEPADWTWPLNTTKTTTYTRVLANSNRFTDAPSFSASPGLAATGVGTTPPLPAMCPRPGRLRLRLRRGTRVSRSRSVRAGRVGCCMSMSTRTRAVPTGGSGWSG